MRNGIIPIVEGETEVIALPLLLRRILEEMEIWDVHIAKPWKVHRHKIVKQGELERTIKAAIKIREEEGFSPLGTLVLLDADDDCPFGLSKNLKERASEQTHLPVCVVLAQMEFEAWFLASKDSLRGVCGIASDAIAPDDCERIRAAKGELTRNMVEGRRYNPITDAPSFVDRLDLEKCHERSRSFRKLVKDIKYLVSLRNETN